MSPRPAPLCGNRRSYKRNFQVRRVAPDNQFSGIREGMFSTNMKFTMKYEMTNKWEFQKEELPFESQAGQLDHHLQSATVDKVDAALKRATRNKALKSGETKLSSSSSSSYYFSSPLLQNILTLPSPLVARCLKHLDASFHEYNRKKVWTLSKVYMGNTYAIWRC